MIELKKFINLLQLNKKHKRKFFTIRLFGKVKTFLKILIKLGFVNYVKYDKQFYIIFLNLETKLKLTPFSKKHSKFVSYETMEKILIKKKWTAILSTNKGFLTTKDCIKQKIGGMVVYNIMCE